MRDEQGRTCRQTIGRWAGGQAGRGAGVQTDKAYKLANRQAGRQTAGGPPKCKQDRPARAELW